MSDDERRNDFVDLAIAKARAGVPIPQIIADLMIAAGMTIAGGAKPGREEGLIAQAVVVLRRGADMAHRVADRDGIHLDGRDA